MRGFILFLAFILVPFELLAQEDAYSSQWLKLLHYQKNGDGYVSLVEKGNFFLTAKGRKNPRAEYDEAIRAFNEKGNLKKCDFPARFMVLKKEGKVSGDLSDCEEYQQYLSDVQPDAVTLLFTDAYMNNPSSMFGHTLFRIDTKRKGTQLLAHGANFGADTGDDHGPLYALRGLWGGYYGHFGLHPYYDVINLYNNIENRDIWEYKLNFTEDELALFTAHMWEMKDAHIRYYFASKNCSYVLLLMLEAARPELDLSSDFSFYAVPLATLKKVGKVSDFITDVRYRPSRQSKLKYRAKQMNDAQQKVFIGIIKKGKVDLSVLNDEEKADVLETAYQYVQYQYVAGDLELKDYRKKSFKLLQERSKIANQRQYFNELKEGENPIEAHEAKQISVLTGVRNGEAFQEIGFKPVYNSLTDDSYGLLKGAEINMLSSTFRHYDRQDKYVLQQLDLLKIRSFSGQDIMFKPFSFEINAAIKHLFDAKNEKEHMAAIGGVSGGSSLAITDNLLIYLLSGAEAGYSGVIKHNGYLGASVKGGMYYNHNKWRLNAEMSENFATDYIARGEKYHVEAGYGLTRNVMLYGKYELFNTKWHDDETIMFGIKVDF